METHNYTIQAVYYKKAYFNSRYLRVSKLHLKLQNLLGTIKIPMIYLAKIVLANIQVKVHMHNVAFHLNEINYYV